MLKVILGDYLFDVSCFDARSAVGATSKAQDNMEQGTGNRQGNAAEQDKAAGGTPRMQGSKRKREDNPQRPQRQAKAQTRQPVGNCKDAQPDGPTGKIVLPQILTRAESVAGDNGTPRGDNNPAAPTSENFRLCNAWHHIK